MVGKRHAILVASSEFPEDSALTPLRCPVQDVERMGEILSAEQHGGFDTVHILKNEPHYEILKAANRIIKNTDRDDMIVFFYSGHGKLDEAGRLYLATSNTNLEVLEATSIPISLIKDYFDVSPARQSAIVLDCCYSGAIEKSFTKGTVDEQLNLMSGGKGTYVLTASTGLQTAKENEGDDLSVFTKHMINGIVSGDADVDHNGIITLNELYRYTYQEVQKDSHQKPMKWDFNVEGELLLARSGKSHWKNRRKLAQEKLMEMGRERTIPNSILTAALSLSEKSPSEVAPNEKAHYQLIEKFAEEEMKSGGFVEAWLKAAAAVVPDPEPVPDPPPQPEPITPDPPTPPIIDDKKDGKDEKDAIKENLVCGAIGIAGFILTGIFISLADAEYGDPDTLLGAAFFGVGGAIGALVYTCKKRLHLLPTSAKIQYWVWAGIFVLFFIGVLNDPAL